MKKVLITGAHGFIGSHTAKLFKQHGYHVIGLDCNYTLDHCEKNIMKYLDQCYMQDYEDNLYYLAGKNNVDAVVHCAGKSLVGPSVKDPFAYYYNNVKKLNNTLYGLKDSYPDWEGSFIFSSSAAIYGNENTIPISESDNKNPVSPYGWSKLMGEQIIKDFCIAYGMKAIALRYFNATGCDLEGELGNRKDDTHIVPRVAKAALSSKPFLLNGNDYATDDGTCVRDYLHVMDIAKAHLMAVELSDQFEDGDFEAYNLGTGRGYSNLEIVHSFVEYNKVPVHISYCERQQGDPDELIANPLKFIEDTGWMPEHSDLETIVTSTYQYMKKTFYNN
jgi:UDP-glucose-4-epimerase GalE